MEEEFPVLEARMMEAHHVKRVVIRQQRKPSGRPIYDDGKRAIYTFNRDGQLSSFQKVFPGLHGKTDTNARTFEYEGAEKIAYEIHLGRYRKRIETHHLDASSWTEKRLVKRGNSPWEVLDEELMRAETKQTQDGKITTIWQGGIDAKPYQRTELRYDQKDRLIHREIWNGARLRLLEHWSYNGERLSSYERDNKEGKDSFIIEYNTDKLLLDEGRWCSNGTCKNWSIVYDEIGLPKGFLFIHPEHQNMEIWEFRYEFWD